MLHLSHSLSLLAVCTQTTKQHQKWIAYLLQWEKFLECCKTSDALKKDKECTSFYMVAPLVTNFIFSMVECGALTGQCTAHCCITPLSEISQPPMSGTLPTLGSFPLHTAAYQNLPVWHNVRERFNLQIYLYSCLLFLILLTDFFICLLFP
jgi:hypothetical protein